MQSVQLHLNACDLGAPQRCSTGVLEVAVQDEEDEEPSFKVREMEFTVPEGKVVFQSSQPGALLGTVARDADPGAKPICYFILGAFWTYFEVYIR